MPDLAQSCQCGTVRWHVDAPNRRVGTRIVCYCTDCQTAARALGAADALSDAGGTDIWQTTPDRLRFETGADQLRILRLSPRGLMRWYAGCCGTPLFNTLPNLGLPFVGAILADPDAAKAAFGPVFAVARSASARPGHGMALKDKNVGRAGLSIVMRLLTGLLSGRARLSPLRDESGEPIAEIRVLSLEERRAAQASSG